MNIVSRKEVTNIQRSEFVLLWCESWKEFWMQKSFEIQHKQFWVFLEFLMTSASAVSKP